MARIGATVEVAWNTADDAVLAEGERILIDMPGRLDNVAVIGVDEHIRCYTHHGDEYVSATSDLNTCCNWKWSESVVGDDPRVFQAGSSRSWLLGKPYAWREGIRIGAMGGFTGFKPATAQGGPQGYSGHEPSST